MHESRSTEQGCVDRFQKTLTPSSVLTEGHDRAWTGETGVRSARDLRKNLRVICSWRAHGHISLLELPSLSLNKLERPVEQAVAI